MSTKKKTTKPEVWQIETSKMANKFEHVSNINVLIFYRLL